MNKELLRETLVRELVDAGDAARAASEPSETELPQRVHKFRKALRRARATLDLLADAIPPRRARAALRAFRDARRAVSVARDHTAVPHILSQLALEESHRNTANEILVAASSASPDPSTIEQTLRAGATAAVAEIEQVSGLVPGKIGWAVPREGLERVYREARRARRDAKDDPEAFHRWRRRSKELMYQLELLGQAFPSVAVYAEELEPLIDAQSLAVDLIMLIGFIKKHGEESVTDGGMSLADFLDQQTSAQMILARRAGRDYFQRKPKDYVRGIREAISVHDNVTSASPSIASSDTSSS